MSNLEGVPGGGGGDVPRGGHAQLPPWLQNSRYGHKLHLFVIFHLFIRRCVRKSALDGFFASLQFLKQQKMQA